MAQSGHGTTKHRGWQRMSVAIATTDLTRRFGDIVAVNGVTAEVPAGQVVGLIGPNGSGKSTIIRILLGLIGATSGSAEVLGRSIEDPRQYADRVGALIETPAFIESMTARDNLRSLAALRGQQSRRIDEVLETVGLIGRDRDRVGDYSLGMKQRLGIAAALLPDPDLLILDEPTNGLDPSGIVEVRRLLRRLGDEGRTVLVSSHLMSEIQAACDSVMVIRVGELLYAGGLDDLLHQAVDHVLVEPESADDTERLAHAIGSAGLSYTVDASQIRVSIDAEDAARVSRVAGEIGVFLKALSPVRKDLESVFLEMTGRTDAEIAGARRNQREAAGGQVQ